MVGIRKIAALILLAIILVAMTTPAAAQVANIPVEKSNRDMAATISGMSDASMANTMIKAAAIDKTMASGSHTLFIPSDSAIKRTGIDLNTVYGVMSNKGMATKMMRGLIMDGSIMPSDMANGKGLTMINGQTMFITDTNGQVALDGVRITRAVQTTNGMVYVLDSIPSSMLQNVKNTMAM
jgi:uncharacterized surface protein with fasciclin (FAS1) repeats